MIFRVIEGARGNMAAAVILIACYLAVIVLSFTAHEFAHAYAAYKSGDRTAKMNGRLTMNPVRHIDPFGFVMLLFVGFGFAKPVPVNPGNLTRRRHLFFVASAGIIVNLVFALIFSACYVAVLYHPFPAADFIVWDVLTVLFYYGMRVNLALAVFNLLPVFPLDGFRIVEAFARQNNSYVRFMRSRGMYIFMGLIVWSVIVDSLCRMFPSAEYILEWFDIIGVVVGRTTSWIGGGLASLWTAIFG